jgi:hypothetical protein
MHTLQYIAVPVENELADPEQEAMQMVESALNEELNPGLSWFDWFVIGGGRWNPEQDPYESSSNMIISFEKEPDKYRAKIEECKELRMAEFKDLMKGIDFADIQDKLYSFDGTMQYFHELSHLKSAIMLAQGYWNDTSFYFDIDSMSTNPKHMLDKLPTEGVNWYLVPVDFHF